MVLPQRDASAIGLRYVSPNEPGITRRLARGKASYLDPDGRPVISEATMARIRSLVIPPAWTEVWICASEDGHIQATGRDARGRLQYRYHPRFRARRDSAKFERLIRFGERLPRIRRRVRQDLALRGLPREKLLAAVIALLETTRFRIGNAEYARLNKSFGISTLRGRHVTVAGATMRFRFRGKGGRTEERELVDRRLAAVVRRCQDLPGQALFQYEGEDGMPGSISSEDVNAYLREAAGSDEFSAKDFRTWTATVLAHLALRDLLADRAAAAGTEAGAAVGIGPAANAAMSTPIDPPPAKVVLEALRRTAEALGDTVAVTRSSYVHPAVLTAPMEAGRRRRTASRLPTRSDELAVLAVLRARARRATSPKAPAAARRTRPRGAAA